MLERHIELLVTDDPGAELPGATRDRLKGKFAPGATRRMTTLGLLVGSALGPLDPKEEDSLIYASGYAESCALEAFLDSFPAPSPTLFQTSIHPSAVQQFMIGRQSPVREFMPLSGSTLLAFHALRAALLSSSPRVILCGGEEKGTWLLEHGLASSRTFAFAASLVAEKTATSIGRIRLESTQGEASLGLSALFDLLHSRRPFDGPIAPGWRLILEWT
ncbi:MAG TPA: hypothetical protein VFE25_05125 [Opitutaceae bacterium]|jgi:hypothetical protein|nr:hypothetical protein [Opitutaceae bacterium]